MPLTTQQEADFNTLLKSNNYTPPPAQSAPGDSQDWYSYVKSNSSSNSQPTPAPQEDHKNLLQHILDFTPLPAVAKAATRTGEIAGDLTLRAINKISGGAVDKLTPEGDLSRALQRAENTPMRVPVLGTQVRPAKDITPENTTGEALNTVAWGVGSPVSAGALMGGGNAMEGDKGGAEVAINTIVGALGGKILEHGLTKVAPYIEKAALKFGQPFIDKIASHIPDSAKGFIDGLSKKVADALPDVSKINIVPKGVGNVINKGSDIIDKGVNTVVDTPFNLFKAGKKTASNIIDDAQTYVSRSNAPENLNSSIDRLAQQPKAVGSKDPLQTYDEFYNQEQKFKDNVKEDPALSVVGTRIGNAYDKVAALRRAAGKTMGEEIAKVGETKTDVTKAFTPLEEELSTNGLTYDVHTSELTASRTSKVTSQDKEMLQTYIKDLNTLGANPTAAELDAFLSRVPRELDVYKGSQNITKVTNGERIIKSNLNALKESLSAKSNPEFAGYAKAKSDYAAYTKFLDEGSSFLGKKTASGDYAKDASIAKSSVQSILNNGKKDWLLKLEDLTGYPALDESMLAIQAMKDAGNFRGNSLLELLSPQSKAGISLSKKGIIDKAVDTAFKFGKDSFIGTPNEQTRRLIQSRLEQGKNTIPTQFPKGEGAIPPTSQLDESLKNLYASAPEAKTYIDSLASNVAEASGSLVAKTGIKNIARAQEKLSGQYGNDISRLTDLARNTIVTPTKLKYGEVLDTLKQQEGIMDFKDVTPESNELGYSGAQFKIKTPNGHVAEIQVNTPEMIYAKESTETAKALLGDALYAKLEKVIGDGGKGHLYYEQWRSDRFSDTARDLAQKSKAYYDEIRSKWQHYESISKNTN